MPAVISADGARIGSSVTGHGPTLLDVAGGESPVQQRDAVVALCSVLPTPSAVTTNDHRLGRRHAVSPATAPGAFMLRAVG
jgi:hypothetical protein